MRKRWHDQRGQALVEMAAAIVLLVTIVIGSTIVGVRIFRHQVVTHAAREGAREAAVNTNDEEVRLVVIHAAAGTTINTPVITRGPSPDVPSENRVTVIVTIPAQPITSTIALPAISGTATMRAE